LEVMEFEGTPEDWEERGEGEESEGESLQGKAWCMVHFEEVSFVRPITSPSSQES